MRRLDFDCLKLFGFNLKVFAAGKLIAPPLVIPVDNLASLLIDHLLAQPVPGFAIDLVEACLLRLA